VFLEDATLRRSQAGHVDEPAGRELSPPFTFGQSP
jgi:hypothetical protein